MADEQKSKPQDDRVEDLEVRDEEARDVAGGTYRIKAMKVKAKLQGRVHGIRHGKKES